MPDNQIGGPKVVHEVTRFLEIQAEQQSVEKLNASPWPLGHLKLDSHGQPRSQAGDCGVLSVVEACRRLTPGA